MLRFAFHNTHDNSALDKSMERRFIILPALLLITDVVKSNAGFRATSRL